MGVTLQPLDNAVKYAVLAVPHVWGGRKAGEMFVFLHRGGEEGRIQGMDQTHGFPIATQVVVLVPTSPSGWRSAMPL